MTMKMGKKHRENREGYFAENTFLPPDSMARHKKPIGVGPFWHARVRIRVADYGLRDDSILEHCTTENIHQMVPKFKALIRGTKPKPGE
ncbi:MAG: hypothetical protein M1835_004053, partial [Candelina submexicana]